jgi:hypothetical protein
MFYDSEKVDNTFHGKNVQALSFTVSCRVQRNDQQIVLQIKPQFCSSHILSSLQPT